MLSKWKMVTNQLLGANIFTTSISINAEQTFDQQRDQLVYDLLTRHLPPALPWVCMR